ncbi:hypothetical protein TSOC_007145 [Tetrabaena socialis]|uniref:VWFA domain-containing protein n=1 Tax=Tetrabaena socialis TaxID=47790 RepID=A0A2J8A1V1_9CHLO|nr:hypothetical protein TSOC_007145 [Tetrabaena socialis]|eukprot:PNH06506.1 hypothetical protein TSOC_007145 [Tetrabaena socialis]
MGGDRIGLVRETCHFLIDQLTPNDYLGLFSYSGDVREDLPLLLMTPEARKLAHLVVEALQASGSTALYDGLEAGVRQQMQAEQELQVAESRVVHSCFLFTDGQATDGRQAPDDIVAGLQVLQAPTDQHMTVHTFGFGAGHSVELLQAVAEAQSGIYYFIKTSEDIATGFGDALGGLLSVVAKNVRVGIRPAPAAALTAFRSGGRMLGSALSAPATSTPSLLSAFGTPSRHSASSAQAAAVVPTAAAFNDMFAEETRECLAVLSIQATGPGTEGVVAVAVVAEVDLEYTDAATGLRVQRTLALQVVRSPAPRPEGQLPAELVFVTVARFDTLDAIEAAQRAAEEGDGRDVSGPHGLLDAHQARLAVALLKSPRLEALAEQTRVARDSIKPRARFDQEGTAARANAVQSLKQQRVGTSTFGCAKYAEQYDVKAKKAYRNASARAAEEFYSKIWTPGHLDTWTPGHLDTWAPGHLGAWSPGRLDTWTPGRLNAWTPGHLGPAPGGRCKCVDMATLFNTGLAASQLPLPRRHELVAAAALAPALAPVFQAGEQPVPAVADLDAQLQALCERVRAAPPAAPAAHAVAGVPVVPLPSEAAAAAGEAVGALSLSAVPEYKQYGVSEGEVVRAVISVKAAAEASQRAQVALTCVLDRSGSMNGDLIGLASQLPLPRRHELVAAAAQAPALAPVFQAGEQPVPAVADLDAQLQALCERVRAAPPAAPAAPAAVGVPVVPLPSEAAAAAGEAVGALSLSAVPEYEQYGVSEGEVVRAVISVKAAAEASQRAQVALTCVLDRSGSMNGDLIGLVKETCHFLIDQLTPNDYLGLFSYSGDVREDLPLLLMTPEARKLAHLVVEELQADGSTALYDGLEAGVRQQMQAEQELQVAGSRVVHTCFLFTDGQATDGPRQPDAIVAGLQVLQAPTDQHVTVHTFGFGDGHSVELLQAVAEAQSGIYYFIKTSEDIATGFGDALGGLLSVVAKNVRVGIRPAPAAALTAFRSGGRMLGSAVSAPAVSTPSRHSAASARGARSAQAAAVVPTAAAFNDMFAEETRECLAALSIQAAGPGTEGSAAAAVVAEVDLEYTDAATGLRVQRTLALQIVRSPAPRPEGQLPAELVFVTVARFETLDAIEAAQRAAEEGDGQDVSGPHGLLDAHQARLAVAPLKSPRLEALAEQTRVARDSIRPRALFDQEGTAARANAVQSLKQQRVATSTYASPQYAAAYDVKAKKDFRYASATANEQYRSKKAIGK